MIRNPRIPSTWTLLDVDFKWVDNPDRRAPPQEMAYNVTLRRRSEAPGCFAVLGVYTVVFSVALLDALTRAQQLDALTRAQQAQHAPSARNDTNRVSAHQVLHSKN